MTAPWRAPAPTPTTGHPLGDALIPAALQLVDAVHYGDARGAHDAIAAAQHAAAGDPYWVFALVCTLAALVPDDRRLSELLAWTQPGHSPDRAAPLPVPDFHPEEGAA